MATPVICYGAGSALAIQARLSPGELLSKGRHTHMKRTRYSTLSTSAVGESGLKISSRKSSLDAQDVVNRRPRQFTADIWGDRFDSFSTEQDRLMDRYAEEVEPLKNEVRAMLTDATMPTEKKMNLIGAVQRLGVSYYYENEIKELLDHIFGILSGNDFKTNYNLHDTAVQFRVFRQHGYKIPCDVFVKFTEEGKFRESLMTDITGIVSLYEAAYLRTHGEYILDEALLFATEILKSVASFSEQASSALQIPVHYNIPRVDCRKFISLYTEEDSHIEALLLLAKIDFNRTQLMYQKELSQYLKWCRDFGFAEKLPYVRRRSVEFHFWAHTVLSEPQYSFGRTLVAKMCYLIAILDDSYDAYGTFEELQLLTKEFERWNLNVIDQFPQDYMKTSYEFTLRIYDEIAKELTEKGKSFAAPFLRNDVILELVRAYLLEATWVKEKYVPTFEEYMDMARVNAGCPYIMYSVIGMEEIVGEKPLQQILQYPKAIQHFARLRLRNDITTHEEEQARGDAPKGVECYMKENNISQDEAVEKLNKIVDDAWRGINEELLCNHDHLPKPVLKVILSNARAIMSFYKLSDGFSDSANCMKDDIFATYAQPFPL